MTYVILNTRSAVMTKHPLTEEQCKELNEMFDRSREAKSILPTQIIRDYLVSQDHTIVENQTDNNQSLIIMSFSEEMQDFMETIDKFLSHST